ncbi:VTT domain-containing protein [bacterium]|nr:VTT domain-containing protein [bacterium]
MEFSFNSALDIGQIILSIILDHAGTLLLYAFLGFLIGALIAFILYRILRKQSWYKRTPSSNRMKIAYGFIRFLFYLGIIGLSSTIALISASNKVVKKEVDEIVHIGTDYMTKEYFQDEDFLEQAFLIYDKLYSSGKELDEINHKLAEGMAVAVAEEYHLGFLAPYLLHSQIEATVKQLEAIEKGMVMIFVAKALEQIQADELIEPEDLDEAFYKWLHNEKQNEFTDINQVISHQIMRQLKPFIFGIWLPFILINSLLILITVVELIVYNYRTKRLQVERNEFDSRE